MLAFIRGQSLLLRPGTGVGQDIARRRARPDQRRREAGSPRRSLLTRRREITFTTDFSAASETMDTWIAPVGGGRPRRMLENAASLTWFNDPGGQRVLFSEMTGMGGQMRRLSSTADCRGARTVYARQATAGRHGAPLVSISGRQVDPGDRDGYPCMAAVPVGALRRRLEGDDWSGPRPVAMRRTDAVVASTAMDVLHRADRERDAIWRQRFRRRTGAGDVRRRL